MNFALVGYGRMGRAVESAAGERGHRLVERLDETELRAALAAGDLRGRLADAEVVFEFTQPDAAETNVRALLESGRAVVCGTTGWSPGEELDRLAEASGSALLVGANFSVGMNLFYRLVREAAALYSVEDLYHPSIVEWHHRGKRDLPSGTARRLGEVLLAANTALKGLREGDPGGAVEPGVVHVTGVRAGREPGTHEVGFDGPHDVITLRHRARSRAAFAAGAVLAGEWIIGKRGVHGFDAVLDELLERGGLP